MVFKATINQSQVTLVQTFPEIVAPKACSYPPYNFWNGRITSLISATVTVCSRKKLNLLNTSQARKIAAFEHTFSIFGFRKSLEDLKASKQQEIEVREDIA